jgi:hypothetical protein
MRKLVLIIAVAMLSFSTSFAGPKEDALDYLHANQLPSGQWGSATPFRDTPDIADTLLSLEGQTAISSNALDYLAGYGGAVK